MRGSLFFSHPHLSGRAPCPKRPVGPGDLHPVVGEHAAQLKAGLHRHHRPIGRDHTAGRSPAAPVLVLAGGDERRGGRRRALHPPDVVVVVRYRRGARAGDQVAGAAVLGGAAATALGDLVHADKIDYP